MVQCDADRVKKVLLIGTEGGKQRHYFEKAAALAGIPVDFLDWKHMTKLEDFYLRKEDLGQYVVKIDAPVWGSCCLEELDLLTEEYDRRLHQLSHLPVGGFWNHPHDIAEVLDKRKCKNRLLLEQVPTTKLYQEAFSEKEALFAFLSENRISQVFVKPVKGSGAAGVVALRYARDTGRLVLYTCAALEGGHIYNTRKMYRLEGGDARCFLDSLLKLDCVVERWHGKATYQGYCYDLRVVVQDGQVDYILPRLSRGPITNLHLNNHSMAFQDLQLDRRTVEHIQEVCLRAAGCYPGLRSIGMDVLLEKETLVPRIIEMNAQGDPLHRDAYGENRIYGRQVAILKEILSRP